MQLINKKAIVTGGGHGIGKAIALAFGKAGADVIVQYNLSKDKAFSTVAEINQIGQQAIAVQSDFTKMGAPDLFIETAFKAFGNIDILVNCAAAYDTGSILELTRKQFSWIYKVNVEIPFLLTQKISEHIISRKGSGSIINISSISSLMPSIGSFLNACSKSSLNMLTRCAALELAQHQIRVNAIAPGTTETGSNLKCMQENPSAWKEMLNNIPLNRAGRPEDYSALAVLLASDASGWITGVTIPCDGGTTVGWR